LPNPDGSQQSWSCANIQPFSSDPTSDECLYGKNAYFTVINATCDQNDRLWEIYIHEGSSNTTGSNSRLPATPFIQHCAD
jgi:hypothetical protein